MEIKSNCCTNQETINLVLTHMCNKECKYCFARDVRECHDGDDHMTLAQVKKILEWAPNARPKLLGGEPTLSPYFHEIVDYMIKEGRDFTLISNFLFGLSTMMKLLYASKMLNVGFLVNATDLDVGQRMDLWKKNYVALKKHSEGVSCGITIQKDRDYRPYVDFLLDNVVIDRMRVSLDMSKPAPIGDIEFGDQIVELVRHIQGYGIPVDVDCVMYPCMFRTMPMVIFTQREQLGIPNFRNKCPYPAMDVFPDETVQFCYPLKDVKMPINMDESYEWHIERFKYMYTRQFDEQERPAECKGCDYYDTACKGPCLASYTA